MTASAPLTFDRATGRLDGASRVERFAAMAMQAASRVTVPFAHRGFSLGCRIFAAGLGGRDIVVQISDDARYAFPFGDAYWSLLLDRGFVYEAEIDWFLRAIVDVDYAFVDCGANFGLWSVLATSRDYGGHPALAIEASPRNSARLRNNARLNGDRFKVIHAAVGRVDGATAWLRGTKHEGMSVTGPRDGTGEPVAMVSLDGLVTRGEIDPGRPLVVKLDVEGMEVEALRGATRLMHRDAVFICEDHGSDRTHGVSRYLLDETRCRLFLVDPVTGRFERVEDLSAVAAAKVSAFVGYNVFAATPGFWSERLAALAQTGLT